MNTHGPVEPDKDNIRQEPYTLPQGFTWDALDLGDRGVVSTGSSACVGRASLWRGQQFRAWTDKDGFGDRNRSFTTPGSSPARWSCCLLGVRWV